MLRSEVNRCSVEKLSLIKDLVAKADEYKSKDQGAWLSVSEQWHHEVERVNNLENQLVEARLEINRLRANKYADVIGVAPVNSPRENSEFAGLKIDTGDAQRSYEYELRCQDLQMQLDATRLELKSIEDSQTDEAEKFLKMKMEVGTLQNKLDESQKRLKKFDEESHALERRLKASEHQRDRLLNTERTLRSEIASLQNKDRDFSALERENDEAKQIVQEAQKVTEEREKRLEGSISRERRLRIDSEKLRRKLNETEEELTRLKEASELKLKRLQTHLESSKQDLNIMRSSTVKHESEVDHLKNMLRDKSLRISEMAAKADQCDDLQIELNRLKEANMQISEEIQISAMIKKQHESLLKKKENIIKKLVQAVKKHASAPGFSVEVQINDGRGQNGSIQVIKQRATATLHTTNNINNVTSNSRINTTTTNNSNSNSNMKNSNNSNSSPKQSPNRARSVVRTARNSHTSRIPRSPLPRSPVNRSRMPASPSSKAPPIHRSRSVGRLNSINSSSIVDHSNVQVPKKQNNSSSNNNNNIRDINRTRMVNPRVKTHRQSMVSARSTNSMDRNIQQSPLLGPKRANTPNNRVRRNQIQPNTARPAARKLASRLREISKRSPPRPQPIQIPSSESEFEEIHSIHPDENEEEDNNDVNMNEAGEDHMYHETMSTSAELLGIEDDEAFINHHQQQIDAENRRQEHIKQQQQQTQQERPKVPKFSISQRRRSPTRSNHANSPLATLQNRNSPRKRMMSRAPSAPPMKSELSLLQYDTELFQLK
eukprot:TRINITY_DN3994_c0_g1_i4.p1 TRINITY_DN3994_c0_g1~~TRINITY_DN3994_c0_g1_i4.p1  ORF type:complete len:889 (+),score=286.02 TRINITY_DN3994_c0_g1_i4:349-2667(+)